MTFTTLKISTYCFLLSTPINTILNRSALGFITGGLKEGEEDWEIAGAVERARVFTGYPHRESRVDLGQAAWATVMSAFNSIILASAFGCISQIKEF